MTNVMPYLKIIAICVKDFASWEEYLYLLPKEARSKIFDFREEADRRRSFASELLKNYYLPLVLQVKSEKIIIGTGCNKRPCLSGSWAEYDFNISHSRDYVVMAVSKNFKIGVDIEYIDSNIKSTEIAEIVFSKHEKVYACTSIESFYILWTKKESLFKAIGTGFMDQTILKKTYLDLSDCQTEWFSGGQIFNIRIFDNYMLSVSLLG